MQVGAAFPHYFIGFGNIANDCDRRSLWLWLQMMQEQISMQELLESNQALKAGKTVLVLRLSTAFP